MNNYERHVANEMPIPTPIGKVVGEKGSLIALANIHVKQVPHLGKWNDDADMSHLTGFRMVERKLMNGRSPDMHVSIGPQPNFRAAIAMYDRARDYKQLAKETGMKAIRLESEIVPMKILSRFLNAYNIKLPKRKFIVAWPV